MTLQEIKDALKAGKRVHWSHKGYVVEKDGFDHYHIICLHNDYCVGLTWLDGVTMNGKEEDFFIGE